MLLLDEVLGKGEIHFVGIWGVSMSALAGFLMSKGVSFPGSDLNENEFTSASFTAQSSA